MKCLYATLYFSSAVIPGALRAAGMCHLGGCALSLRQAESGLSSRQPARRGVSHRDPLRQRGGCELLGAGATFLKSCKRFRFCSSAHAVWTRRGAANGLGTAAPYKEGKLLEGRTWPRDAGARFPACERTAEAASSRRDLRGAVRGRYLWYNYVSAFPLARVLRN